MCKKCDFLEYFWVFLAEKPPFLQKNIDYHCMNKYGETMCPSLTASEKRAMIFKFVCG